MPANGIAASALRRVRQICVLVIGGTVLLLGLAMVVLPGPAIVVMPAGLAILSIEFAWARRWLGCIKARFAVAKPAAQRGADKS